MAVGVTADSSASVASSDVRWSVTTLSSHLLGTVNQQRNAAAGSVPNRLTNEVRQAGIDLWTSTDWIFRRKIDTLTTTADQAYIEMFSDFAELEVREVYETYDETNDTWLRLTITQNPEEFARAEWAYKSTDTGTPLIGLMLRNTAETTFKYKLQLVPIPDKAYSYKLPYIILDPWSPGSIDDDEFPVWPITFFHGWQLNAAWRVEKAFRPDDRWEASKKLYDVWRQHQIAENNETQTIEQDPIMGGYDDGRHMASLGSHSQRDSNIWL